MDTEEIVFCQACGGNMHYDCMKKWEEQQQPGSDSETEATCPLCRAEWTGSDNTNCACPELDAESFSMYTEWLYSQRVSIGTVEGFGAVGTVFEIFVKVWGFGRKTRDKNFLKAILRGALEVIQDTDNCPSTSTLGSIYRNTSTDCALRKLLMSAYVRRGKAS